MMFLLLWALLVFPHPDAQAYYESGYHYYPSYRSQTPSPIISIDLDPQHQVDASFRVAAREDRLDDMMLDVKRGAHVDSVSDSGRSALMFASGNCSVPIVRELLSLKANVNITDHEGETALDYATLESCYPVVKLLMKVPGLDLGVKDKSGKTAYDYAVDCASLDVDGPAARILNLIERYRRRHH